MPLLQAITRLYEWGRELTRLLKDQDDVPKKHLFAIFQAPGILENEAAEREAPKQKRILEIVDAIRLIFYLLLTGQSRDEYVHPRSGVPRVR